MSHKNAHKEGYKPSPLCWIPKEWLDLSIGDVIAFSGGSQPPQSTFIYEPKDGYIRLIQTRDYRTDKYQTFIPIKEAKKRCFKNDIMVGRYGPPLFQIFKGLEGAYNVALIKAVPDETKVDKEYCYYFLSRPELRYYLEGLSQRSGGQTGIEMDRLNNYPFPVPTPGERKEIVSILKTSDEAISKTQQLITQLQQRNNGLMQQLLTAKHDWKEYRIGDLLKEVKRPVAWDDEELYHLISVRRRSGGAFFRESLYGKQILTKQLFTAEAGDFLISKMQIVHGASAVVLPEFDSMKISGSYIAVHAQDDDVMDINFFNWLSKTKWFYKLTYISSYGVHIEKMTFDFDDFKRRKIMLPPSVGEQKNIVTILQTAADEVKLYEHKLAALQQQKKGLMQKLLTGEVRVKIDNNKN